MKAQKFVRILMLLAILGIVIFPVAHSNTEVVEKNTESKTETEDNSDATKDSEDVEVSVETEVEFEEAATKLEEVETKLEEVIDKVIEKEIEGIKVEISEPEPTVIIDSFKEAEELKELKEKIKKLVEDGNFDSDEIVKKLKELVDDMKIVKASAVDGNIVTVLQYAPYGTTETLFVVKAIKELEDKIKEFASDEGFDSDELVKKVQNLVKGMKSDSFIVLPDPFIVPDKDNVKVYTYGPYVKTKTFKDAKGLSELGEKISKLVKDDDLESDELAKKVLELIKDATPHIGTGIIRGNVKVLPLEPSKSLKEVNDSNIEKLEKRIEKLETKLDMLIEKISELNPESTEDE